MIISIYYNGNKIEEKSIYKQFTYARNIIQVNINEHNNNGTLKTNHDCYRNKLTEGYNIIPNFFIDGYIDDISEFDDDKLNKTEKTEESYHFENRLFDRDTLFIEYYKIDFLYVLKSYTSNSSKAINFKKNFQEKVREDFREHLNSIVTFYEFKEEKKKKFKNEKELEKFIYKYFKLLNGKCYITKDDKFILALYKGDEENFKEEFNKFILALYKEDVEFKKNILALCKGDEEKFRKEILALCKGDKVEFKEEVKNFDSFFQESNLFKPNSYK